MIKETVIISLGGSLIVPDGIDWRFLKAFRELILKHSNRKRFVIITGGGKTARNYIQAAAAIAKTSSNDRDWLGIYATRLNAHLVRTLFGKKAYPTIIENPNAKLVSKQNIIIAAGYKPGCSTDYDAVLMAKNLGAKSMVNLTNITYVYKHNPKVYKHQKPIKHISWEGFQRIVGNKWKPGANLPFDPIATRMATKLKLKVYMLNGKLIKNLDNFLAGKRFIGSIIS